MPIASLFRSSMLCRRGFGQLAVGAVAACVGGVGTARAQGTTPVRFALDRRFDALTAPFLAAQDKGYFGTEGLDVVIEPGNGARAMLQRLASGAQDAGFGDINALIRFRDENPSSDLKAVMIVHDRPGYALIGRKSRGITTAPTSLEGRKLGTASIDASFAQWPLFKNLNKIDDSKIRIETIGLPVREPMLASGEIDALFAFGPSTAVSLKARGVPGDDIVLMEMAEHGLVLYGSAVIVSGKLLASKPDAVRGLVRAVMRGIRDVAVNPGAGAQFVLRRNESAQADVERDKLAAVIERNVLTPYVRAHGLGGIDRERWTQALGQLALAGAFRDKARAGDAFTDAYLPPASERMF
ncbi:MULTISPECIES: ABC transporter substrate-binding protein [Bosea]|uniref:ABC transporter substrate-binding protein n=1 Tax=Bosea TaxID=85413 RepID=UPI00214FEAE9|nr:MULTISPECIES: ABC transporter substrate-binding protein [Bosea]MCR4522871.1 ABC transporter substrate-binding protein [Bosea sp. 47.2.35]MDR6828212.1 NitT/TauT family transport system substrate-binding protein [Bosea robiniae]MDR6897816.1 NitT/TauT family transport system substrate-binding protein [Bosea sp. BE109]MDR7141211.1 NitT/TauT family transport system substrate-binding protein [Bosea sp. BE168]MDR7177873.1 NitT/TauT family transport system substrate-binding protein [Bosea sp. BE271